MVREGELVFNALVRTTGAGELTAAIVSGHGKGLRRRCMSFSLHIDRISCIHEDCSKEKS